MKNCFVTPKNVLFAICKTRVRANNLQQQYSQTRRHCFKVKFSYARGICHREQKDKSSNNEQQPTFGHRKLSDTPPQMRGGI